MPLILNAHCHNRPQFLATHALGHLPTAVAPVGGWPAGSFVVGSDFFTIKTVAELQEIVDTTYEMRKKLDFSGTGGTPALARALVANMRTGSGVNITVRWGIHEPQAAPAGVGNCKHFTTIGVPADWHCYVSTDGSRLSFMTNAAGPAGLVTIKKF